MIEDAEDAFAQIEYMRYDSEMKEGSKLHLRVRKSALKQGKKEISTFYVEVILRVTM